MQTKKNIGLTFTFTDSIVRIIFNSGLKCLGNHVRMLLDFEFSLSAGKIEKISYFSSQRETIAGASSPPRQPRQLPWLIFETIINYKKWPKQLGRFQEKSVSLFFYQAKNLLKYILWFFCRIEKIYIILPSKKYTGSSLQN